MLRKALFPAIMSLFASVMLVGGFVFLRSYYIPVDSSAAGEAATGTLTFSTTLFPSYQEKVTISDGTDSMEISFVNMGGVFSSCTGGTPPACTSYDLDIGGGNDSGTQVASAITTLINSTTLHAVDMTAVNAGSGVVNLSGNTGNTPLTLSGVGSAFLSSVSNSGITLSGWANFNEVLTFSDGVDSLQVTFVNNGGGFSNCSSGSAPNCTEYNLDIGGGNDDATSVASSLVTLLNDDTIHSVGISATNEGSGVMSFTGSGITVSDDTPAFISATGMTVSNSVPVLSSLSVGNPGDGSGERTLTVTANDDDDDTLSIEVKYIASSTCAYASASAALVSSTASGVNSGSLSITTSSQYQIGSIDSSTTDEVVTAYWLSAEDAPTADGTYCVFMTPYDGNGAGTTVSTTATIDNTDPTVPGALTVASRGTTEVTLTFGTTSTDSNFSTYAMYYKTGTSSVSTSDTQHTDDDFFDVSFSGTSTTTISGLSASTTYVVNIWAQDTHGNATSSATELSFTTRAEATATNFATSTGSTDLSAVDDITAVADLTLATATSSVTTTVVWTNDVDAEGADLDDNVTLGAQFVSVNAEELDASFDSEATVTFTGVDCSNYEIYYTSTYYTTLAEIIANGQLCNAGTTPACTVNSCTDGTLIFTVPHFDGFGINEPQAEVNNNDSSSSSSGGGGGGNQVSQRISKANSISVKNPDVQIFSINNGATETNSRQVKVTFGVTNYPQVAISENEDFAGASLIEFTEEMSYMLSEDLGEKTVYVKLTGPSLSPVVSEASILLVPSSQEVEEVPEVVEEAEVPEEKEEPTPEVEEVLPEFTGDVSKENCPLEKGKPYQTKDDKTVVYVSELCTQTPFVTREKYFSYFTSFDDIEQVRAERLAMVPEDELGFLPFGPLYAPDYDANGEILVKTIFAPRVYVARPGKRLPIASEEIFKALGFVWQQVIDVVPERLDDWEEGPFFEEGLE